MEPIIVDARGRAGFGTKCFLKDLLKPIKDLPENAYAIEEVWKESYVRDFKKRFESQIASHVSYPIPNDDAQFYVKAFENLRIIMRDAGSAPKAMSKHYYDRYFELAKFTSALGIRDSSLTDSGFGGLFDIFISDWDSFTANVPLMMKAMGEYARMNG